MDKFIFKRKSYKSLLEWKEKHSTRNALLVKGAKGVGKTTLVKEFAKNEFKTYILIDFKTATKEIISLFDDMQNLDWFFLKLQQFTHVRLYEHDSVIIFDEVEYFPRARQAIKYLVADGR
ncbi:MAG: AAA family ATPase [Succinivibrio sp.]|jgi:predicted AAA+ superfamily ATPase|nr:AAA family ATPase [Succinivibrio sp.]